MMIQKKKREFNFMLMSEISSQENNWCVVAVVFGGSNVEVTHFPSNGLPPGMMWVLSLPTRKCTLSKKVCRLLCEEDIWVSWMMSRGSGEPMHKEVV